jgi:two-component system NtrC family sensor kinase
MLALALHGWFNGLASVDNVADTASTLVLLVAAVLIYRTFRERYLFFWIIGWSAFLLYQISLAYAWSEGYTPSAVALTYIAFLFSTALLSSAVFDYIQRQQWLTIVVLAMFAAMGFAVGKAYLAPQNLELELLVQILYRIGTIAAGLQLTIYSRGRKQLSLWLLSAMLFLVHIDFDITRPNTHEALDSLLESLLGLSMLVLVLDESRTRTRRLDVINEVISSMATTEDPNALVLTALQQLKKLMTGKAAWFRLISGDQLEMHAHTGLSDRFLQARWKIPVSEDIGRERIEAGNPVVVERRTLSGSLRESLDAERLAQLVVIPVQGKTAIIGILVIGNEHIRRYKEDELRFLTSAARQLGIAIENAQLINQILRSQRQWASTFDALPDPILVHDQQNQIIKANRSLLNKLGLPAETVVGKTCESVLPQFGRAWSGCPYCGDMEPSGFRDQPDACFGGYAIVSTNVYTTDENSPVGTVHIIRDTTARRAAEERYRTLFEQVQEGVFVSTPDGRVIDCNDAFVHLLGYERREEVLARDIAQHFYANPNDRRAFLEKISKDGSVKNFEVNLRRKDGSIVIVLENSYATRTASGNISRYHGVLQDITEQKRAENEIRRRNRELEALNAIAVLASQSFDRDEIINVALRQLVDVFRADTAAIFLYDAEQHLLRRTAAFGHNSEIGSTLQDVTVPADFWQYLIENRVEIVTQRDLGRLPSQFSAFVQAESLLSWVWVLMWSGEKIVGVLGVSSRQSQRFTDRDEGLMIALGRQLANSIEKVRLYEETSKAYDHLRRTQEQLLQSEKMSAVGQLISGVAHELNNPLTAILGYAQLLETEQLTEHQHEFVNKLYKQAQRTHRVVQNLLSFARQRKPAKLPVDVRRIVEDTLALRDYDLNLNNITVQKKFESVVPPVVADSHQLEQVFLNIINNSVDAMLEHARGGQLEVTITAQNAHVSLEFHDSGPGIREINKIFDPFYTTKSVGKGTGLGLSICYGIIKEHGGDIRAFNHANGGACLQVILPTVGVPAEAALPTTVAGRTIPLQGRVLIVDDEEAVLEFEREVLKGVGAEVTTFNSGESAIECLQENSFDAVIVDSSMPGKFNGIDVYRWLMENRPNLAEKVIFTLSSLSDSDLRDFLDKNKIAHITKPFEVSELIAITGQMFQRRQSAAAV